MKLDYEELDYEDEAQIKSLLMGRRVTKVNDTTLELDDGRILKIRGNEGCGGCSSGWYEIEELNDCPNNAIFNVEFEHTYDRDEDAYYRGNETYRIFVYAENEKIKLLEVNGTDGNGYYGSGYWIDVING
jgi:hypothetical protein